MLWVRDGRVGSIPEPHFMHQGWPLSPSTQCASATIDLHLGLSEPRSVVQHIILQCAHAAPCCFTILAPHRRLRKGQLERAALLAEVSILHCQLAHSTLNNAAPQWHAHNAVRTAKLDGIAAESGFSVHLPCMIPPNKACCTLPTEAKMAVSVDCSWCRLRCRGGGRCSWRRHHAGSPSRPARPGLCHLPAARVWGYNGEDRHGQRGPAADACSQQWPRLHSHCPAQGTLQRLIPMLSTVCAASVAAALPAACFGSLLPARKFLALM